MVTRYDVTISVWSSHFWIKMRVVFFNPFSVKEAQNALKVFNYVMPPSFDNF